MQLHHRVMHPHKTAIALWLALLAGMVGMLALAGCQSAMNGCESDADCPGGVCVALAATRECRPLEGADLASGGPDGGADLQRGPPDAFLTLDAIAAECHYNGDGVIERSEEPFIVGLGALFAVNPSGSTASVDLNAQNGVWDFSAAVPNETKTYDQLLSPAGAWWAGDFPNATYAELLEEGQSLYGVYAVTSTALQLLGIVSSDSGVQRTELTYDTPIDMIRFPLTQTSSWTIQANVSGTASGAFFAAQETWSFTVDARGTAKVPAASFDTLRLRANYTQTYGLLVTQRIIYLHLAECYGAVARIRSQDNEPSNDFTQAAEYRRLAAP
jgi:hypothetical protein